MAAMHLKQRDGDNKLKVEALFPTCEPCDYKLKCGVVDTKGNAKEVTISRRQALELRDWITRIEMYGKA